MNTEQIARDIFLLLNDHFDSLDCIPHVLTAKAEDIYYFEDQSIVEYYSYGDQRLSQQNGYVEGKIWSEFDNPDDCFAVSKDNTEGIMKLLLNKYEEYYQRVFEIKDYTCSVIDDEAICSYTIERVKNGLTYEGILEYKDCDSIRNHIRDHEDEFKDQMNLK